MAYYVLDAMHLDDGGLLKDHVQAHAYFNIAAQGHDEAVQQRQKLEASMTFEHIAKAQGLVRRCVQSNYKDCGW
ncbi:MAG: hypothetical protein GYB18_08445 [Oceanospirillales bacterium]|nr:hypothetical protein [Oceanospirillales bacterium]